MISRSSGEPLIWLSVPPRRPPALFGGLWQLSWQRRDIYGWPCLTSKRRTGSSFWTPCLRLLACSAMMSILSSTGTRRPVNKRQRFSGSCLAALQLRRLLDGSSPLCVYRLVVQGDSETGRGRGLRSQRQTCGPFFRLGRHRPQSPDVHGPGLMGVAPSVEKQCTPQHTVPVSPQCLQEIGLAILPLMVLQGAAIIYLSALRPGA